MPGRFIPPEPERGDANTIGGYALVHGRPAAFEGSDGLSYSVSIEVDATGEPDRPFGAWFLFLRWRRMGIQGVEGHVESGYLEYARTGNAARVALGGWRLSEVKRVLDEAIRHGQSESGSRRWWDAMRDERGE